MRWIFLLLLLLFVDGYVFLGLRTLISSWSAPWKQVAIVTYWSVPVLLLITLGIYFGTNWSEQHKHLFTFLRTFLFITYLAKVFAAIPLLVDDLRRTLLWGWNQSRAEGPVDLSRSRFLSQAGMLLGGIPLVLLTYGMIRNPYRYKLFKEKIRIPGLPDDLRGLRIVQISDIHSGSFTLEEPVEDAIALINAQQADLVFFTGDLVNEVADEMEGFQDTFSRVQARLGVFSVLGNHDYGDYAEWPSAKAKAENLDRLKQIHRDMGWDLLLNEHRKLQIGQSTLGIIGVENYSAHPRFPKYGDLKAACDGCEDAQVQLLLSHDPSHWMDQVVPDFPEIDITFSGHTHGMQFGVEIPGWLKWSPIQYVYEQWAGLYQQGRQYLYVNRGLGFIGYPGRVGILPEISLIELERA